MNGLQLDGKYLIQLNNNHGVFKLLLKIKESTINLNTMLMIVSGQT